MPIVKRIASEEYADEKASYEANKAVENAPQADWNQSDETALDFIKNKPTTAIKPFPYYDVNEVNANVTQYKVNLETLEPGILYSVQESASTTYTMFGLFVICEDGTERIVTNVSEKRFVYYIIIQNKEISLYNVFNNSSYRIDISDKSTAKNIVVTSNFISSWLPTNNTNEYTPTSKYHPATKKYVDDSVANSIPVPATATVGQTIIVKSVDKNGKPVEWEAVDMPTDEHINALIDAKLEAIENGTY